MWVALFSGYICRYMNVHKLNGLAQSFYQEVRASLQLILLYIPSAYQDLYLQPWKVMIYDASGR